MRIWRHHDHEEPATPAWQASKPQWAEVHIQAKKAVELVHDDEHLPHAAA
jgi:hypothetical protein